MIKMTVLISMWFAIGAIGAALAHRGSIKKFGRNIYSRRCYVVTVIFGFFGFCGSVVAW